MITTEGSIEYDVNVRPIIEETDWAFHREPNFDVLVRDHVSAVLWDFQLLLALCHLWYDI